MVCSYNKDEQAVIASIDCFLMSVFVIFVYSSLHSCHDIVLRRSYLGSWGFSIVGGYEENHTNQPFFIKTIVLGTPAYYDGRLK